MTQFTIDEKNAIATFEVSKALTEDNFKAAAQSLDPFIENNGDLSGLIIKAEHFAGWENIGSLMTHLKFVKDHHKDVKKVAFVTDSRLLELLPKITGHFVNAEVKTFEPNEANKAKDWILAG